ncbi:No apical meristem (NAM) protein [Corchorus capsularis]|uniref:No apical meristem (NAM) protein n=1 Tax=Corchorus capsularis TaxID=210143 RepID=A0A1R3HQC6_COCAP|nr:No apical meristem (NAM) protein [Corchorus capsularis]
MAVQLPPGFRFMPTEEQLLHGYLLKKVKGEALPCDIVTDCDIYGDGKEPWKIFGENSTEKFYVFAKLKKVSANGKNIERKAGTGTWKGQKPKIVKDSNNNHIGLNKSFVFQVKNSGSGSASSNVNGHWLMHEYSLVNDQSGYVLCVIRNKISNSEQVEDEDKEFTAEEFEDKLSTPEIQPFSHHQQQQNYYMPPLAALSYY